MSEILDADGAGLLLKVSKVTLWRLRKDQGLPYFKAGREIRFLREDVFRWARQRKYKEAQLRLGFGEDRESSPTTQLGSESGYRLHRAERHQDSIKPEDTVRKITRLHASGAGASQQYNMMDEPILSTRYGVLYQTDCMNLFAAIKDFALDCIFADPPFNLGKVYGKGEVNDALEARDYLKWSYAWLDECVRVLKPGGALFVYIIPQWGYHFATHMEQQGMLFRHWIAISMKGTFPRGRKLYPAHYGLLYFTKGIPKTFNRVRLPIPKCRHCGKDIKDYGGHRKYLNPLGLNLTDFWDDTAPARHRKFKARWHVNELKPMIPSRCFEIATDPGEIVLDPFGGGGSSYEAAQCLKRYWVGSEIVDCQHIIERFKGRFPADTEETPPKRFFSIFR